MTARPLGMAALGAAVVVATGVVVAPLLPHATTAAAQSGHRATIDVPGRVMRTAKAAAHAAVSCTPAKSVGPTAAHADYRWCGQLQVSGTSATCPTSMRCQVELVGTITAASVPVPVALTITLSRSNLGWQVREVRS